MLTVDGTAGLRARAGEVLGVSDWWLLTQRRIDAFAAATGDHEQIHVSPERAARTPWGVTIAHGLFTLGLGPKFLYEIFTMQNISLWLNYGYDRVRFISPVLVDSRVRMHATLSDVSDVDGGVRVHIAETFEVEGRPKPACVADFNAVYYD